MMLSIKYLGQAAELVGHEEEERTIPASTSVHGLRQALESFFPKLATINYKIAVNHQLVGDDWILEGDCEIGVLPPFAGG